MTFRILKLDRCGSTNDVAKEMARAGAAEGTAVVALEQTAGRGTKGRTWYSSRGHGLYVSVLLRPHSADLLPLLPLAAGLAARAAVERVAGLSAGLRWPNDIVWKGRKLGGLLCETAFAGAVVEYAVVGLGLNLTHEEADFPAGLRDFAVSVRRAGGRSAEADEILEAYLAELGERSSALAGGRASRLVEDFESFSVLKPGDAVAIDTSEGVLRGTYRGIAADGTLPLDFPSGERRFSSGDIIRLV
jgi:BirA family biotin operon repressor/biotin-[acetyl-CoA-carboxylase] ligase